MGCDGGSIPKRGELVRVQKQKERTDPALHLLLAWFFCKLSRQPLAAPVVADGLGRLYNKSAILEFLLNRSRYGDGDLTCPHITSLKDVVSLTLTPNPLHAKAPAAATVVGNIDERPTVAAFICPITGREMNGKSRFSYLATCGCVFSNEALRNVPSTACLRCNAAYAEDDVVPINPTDPAEIQTLTDLMAFAKERRADEAKAKKAAKKAAKKDAKKASAGGVDAGDAAAGTKDADEDGIPALRAATSSEDDAVAAVAVGKKRKKSKKTKSGSASGSDNDNDEEYDGHAAKKRSAVARNINMVLPDLSDRSQLPTAMRMQSDAIKSLYRKSNPDEKEPNFLVRGTFNRFAAGF